MERSRGGQLLVYGQAAGFLRVARKRPFWRTNPKGAYKDWARRRQVRRAGVLPVVAGELRSFGQASGRWPVLVDRLSSEPTVWSFGVGFDLSFECEFLSACGGRVRAFDPTPRSFEWASTLSKPSGLRVERVGLGAENGEASFVEPRDPRSANFRVISSRGVSSEERPVVRCPIRRLETFVDDLGEKPDLLKIDIEGGEFDVIGQIADLRPEQLLIEFHHGMWGYAFDDTCEAIRTLGRAGYSPFWVSRRGLEFGFSLSSEDRDS